MPKIVNVEEEKRLILEAFERCVLKSPMDKVTVRAIAQEAGISHSKIFLYFENRDEIVAAYAKIVADLYSDGFEHIAKRNQEEPLTKKEILELMTDELFDLDPENIAALLYLQIYVLGQYDPEMKEIVDEIYEDWRESLRLMLKDVQPDVSEAEIRTLLVLIEGILVYRMNAPYTKENGKKLIEHMF